MASDSNSDSLNLLYSRYPREKSEKLKLRRINSAIYAKDITSDIDDVDELTATLSNISFISSSVSSPSAITATNCTKPLSRIERRCIINDNGSYNTINAPGQVEIQRYDLNGRKVIHISTSLLSCTSSNQYDSNKISVPQNRAHAEWKQKKRKEFIRQKKMAKLMAMRKKIDEERLEHEKIENQMKERENFRMWKEKKKQEEEAKRKAVERKLEMMREFTEIEAIAISMKNFRVQQWERRKKKLFEARKEEREQKIKQNEEEKKRKKEESAKAYAEWFKKTKNRPRPATQGLLPHQRATPSYINPNPWIFDDKFLEMENETSDAKSSNDILSDCDFVKTILSQ